VDALATLVTEAGAKAGSSRTTLETAIAEAADPDQVEAVAAQAVSRFGRIDTWAHVAGVAEYGRFEDVTVEEFRRVIDVTLLGPVWGARAALPHLRQSKDAYVVVSSEIAKRAFPLASSYGAAKHGVDGFVEALRLELEHEHTGVSVTQIMPAAIATPFFEHARSRLGVRASGPPPVYAPEKVAEAILNAALHGGRDVTVGSAAAFQLALQRVSPRIMDAFSRATAFQLQRSTEKRSSTDDALFETPTGDDRVHGVVTNTHR